MNWLIAEGSIYPAFITSSYTPNISAIVGTISVKRPIGLPSEPTDILGTFLPKELRILSASVTSFVNGTLSSGETSSYALFLDSNLVYGFNSTLDHSNTSQYFIEKLDTDQVDFNVNDLELPLSLRWTTPAWGTSPTSVSHNIVFYCTRKYSAP